MKEAFFERMDGIYQSGLRRSQDLRGSMSAQIALMKQADRSKLGQFVCSTMESMYSSWQENSQRLKEAMVSQYYRFKGQFGPPSPLNQVQFDEMIDKYTSIMRSKSHDQFNNLKSLYLLLEDSFLPPSLRFLLENVGRPEARPRGGEGTQQRLINRLKLTQPQVHIV